MNISIHVFYNMTDVNSNKFYRYHLKPQNCVGGQSYWINQGGCREGGEVFMGVYGSGYTAWTYLLARGVHGYIRGEEGL